MFCMNCGGKLIEGAKFCPNCGCNIAAILGQEQEKMVLPETTPAIITSNRDSRRIEVTEDKVIEDIFTNIFHIRGEFGKQVFIAGKDKIMSKEDIIEHV